MKDLSDPKQGTRETLGRHGPGHGGYRADGRACRRGSTTALAEWKEYRRRDDQESRRRAHPRGTEPPCWSPRQRGPLGDDWGFPDGVSASHLVESSLPSAEGLFHLLEIGMQPPARSAIGKMGGDQIEDLFLIAVRRSQNEFSKFSAPHFHGDFQFLLDEELGGASSWHWPGGT